MTFAGAYLSNGLPFAHHGSTWQFPFWVQTVSEELGSAQGPDWPLAIWLSFCASGCSSSVSKHPFPNTSKQVARRHASLDSSLSLQGGCTSLETCQFLVTAVHLHVFLRYLQLQAQISEPCGCSLQRAHAYASPQNHRAGATLAR